VVFEKGGYQNRASSVEVELYYVGNCIEYILSNYSGRAYISNTKNIELISSKELERIENRSGTDVEQFELIDSSIKEVEIRGKRAAANLNPQQYDELNIPLRKHENPRKLIGFGDLVRYFVETNPLLIYAQEEEIRTQIPEALPKIMTIDSFHHLSVYNEDVVPSEIETFQLIAKVLVSKNSTIWKPTLTPNNHWSNWKSGNL
ncbi:MAG: hypothetical protein AAFO02_18115, partial [Bacteroidota bacterium]